MKDESGFSLTELMTALTIGSIIVGFCYAAYGFGTMVFSDYVRRTDATDLASRSAQRIALDLQSAKSVILESDTAMSIVECGGRRVYYRFSDSLVTRDSVAFDRKPGVSMKAAVKRNISRYTILVNVKSGSHLYRAEVEVQVLEGSASAFAVEETDAGTH